MERIATLFQVLFQSRLFTNFFRCIFSKKTFECYSWNTFREKNNKFTGFKQRWKGSHYWPLKAWLVERRHVKFCKSPAIHFRILINQTNKFKMPSVLNFSQNPSASKKTKDTLSSLSHSYCLLASLSPKGCTQQSYALGSFTCLGEDSLLQIF